MTLPIAVKNKMYTAYYKGYKMLFHLSYWSISKLRHMNQEKFSLGSSEELQPMESS